MTGWQLAIDLAAFTREHVEHTSIIAVRKQISWRCLRRVVQEKDALSLCKIKELPVGVFDIPIQAKVHFPKHAF